MYSQLANADLAHSLYLLILWQFMQEKGIILFCWWDYSQLNCQKNNLILIYCHWNGCCNYYSLELISVTVNLLLKKKRKHHHCDLNHYYHIIMAIKDAILYLAVIIVLYLNCFYRKVQLIHLVSLLHHHRHNCHFRWLYLNFISSMAKSHLPR